MCSIHIPLGFSHKVDQCHPPLAGIQTSKLVFALQLKIKSTNIYLVLNVYQVLVGKAKKKKKNTGHHPSSQKTLLRK